VGFCGCCDFWICLGVFLGFVFSGGGYYVSSFWVEFFYVCLFVSGLFFGFVPVVFFLFCRCMLCRFFVVEGGVWYDVFHFI
jgi:hypothetical protein